MTFSFKLPLHRHLNPLPYTRQQYGMEALGGRPEVLGSEASTGLACTWPLRRSREKRDSQALRAKGRSSRRRRESFPIIERP